MACTDATDYTNSGIWRVVSTTTTTTTTANSTACTTTITYYSNSNRGSYVSSPPPPPDPDLIYIRPVVLPWHERRRSQRPTGRCVIAALPRGKLVRWKSLKEKRQAWGLA